MKFNLIQVQTVSGCNGNCIFCPSSYSWMKNHPGKMSDEDYILVLERIKEAQPDFDGQFCPYLMNEPTLDDKLIERIELAFKYFPKCNIEVSTNAMKLTPKLAEQLVDIITKNDKSRKSHIWISHHAINKETYESIMRRKNYAQILNNIIEYLMINDGQVITILRGSGASADGTITYFTEDEYHDYWVRIFKENNLNPANVKVDYFRFHNRAGEVKMKDWKEANEFYRAIDRYHPFSCWRFVSGLHVLYNLDVVVCCMDYSCRYIWGNLRKESIKEIWNGEKRRDFVDKATGLKPSNSNFICKRCMSVGG